MYRRRFGVDCWWAGAISIAIGGLIFGGSAIFGTGLGFLDDLRSYIYSTNYSYKNPRARGMKYTCIYAKLHSSDRERATALKSETLSRARPAPTTFPPSPLYLPLRKKERRRTKTAYQARARARATKRKGSCRLHKPIIRVVVYSVRTASRALSSPIYRSFARGMRVRQPAAAAFLVLLLLLCVI